ncbi:hypothetical protein I4I73_15640 [Pseudonocardia sp. KRD-184]|uniref:DNA-3-methyladenine glycosylase 2 family protein n=1 Tax=Pseudonocardia oceani TaxID=2792013 RepID=A0ABS6U8C9_9PSEU|nr:DUF6308 family protein [Pseudonocardia oceani]MBW0090221.1 hypothetical protein [Pseudonocardia oceani]MBW0097415.1 hypothetical protein [Pseudonocardia oceani]MBW0124190.1 hypothetical protein [Pseudonocardia oceani]MBW0128480.1 hypothetical protein [Pseudonocardia oceani]
MAFQLPESLQSSDDDAALALLTRYYGRPFAGPGSAVGAAFDHWDSTGTRVQDVDRFTADDLVAVTFLSVDVSATAARALLRERADEFAALLADVGQDRDLVDEVDPLADDWAGWAVMSALRGLDRIGPTTASKLLARKRPRLRPIWDTVVTKVTGSTEQQWEPLRQALRADDAALHHRLLRLRAAAGLPDDIGALRIFDVICWREGKDRGW